MMKDRQHADHTTFIDHAEPHTTSREVYKGVLDDKARAVFQGKILVRPDAQHIGGHQLTKTLLLSDGAEIDAKPELEIYADDVQCSHGATAGELDDTALFYLRSRGIPEDQARGPPRRSLPARCDRWHRHGGLARTPGRPRRPMDGHAIERTDARDHASRRQRPPQLRL